MPTDYGLELRQSIVTHLKGGLTSLPPEQVHGEYVPANPVYPLVRYGNPTLGPYEAQGYDGSENTIALHAFAPGPASDGAYLLAADIVATMYGYTGPAGVGIVELEWLSTNVMRDPETPDLWHAAILFTVTVA